MYYIKYKSVLSNYKHLNLVILQFNNLLLVMMIRVICNKTLPRISSIKHILNQSDNLKDMISITLCNVI